jgi:hypothetical protein
MAPVESARGREAGELPATLTQRQIKVYEAMGFDWKNKDDRARIIEQERTQVEERRDRRHG